MEQVLETITEIIEEYESGAWVTIDRLRVLQRKLTANIYYLTQFNIEYQNKWNAEVYNHKGSNAAGRAQADLMVPEARQTSKIIDAARTVSISMSNELAILKHET